MVIFSLSDSWYAIDDNCIVESIPMTTIHYVPGMPDDIIGIVLYNDKFESLLDISGSLGIEFQSSHELTKILIVDTDGIRTGIPVKNVICTISTTEQIQIKSNSNPYVIGEFSYKGENVNQVDIGKIFSKLKSA